jgi:exodeoxyribonuclease VII small subunit
MADLMEDEISALTFEAALARLDVIVGQLEAGELTLELSLALFEEGQLLAKRCAELLEQAELRVEALTADGEIVEVSPE